MLLHASIISHSHTWEIFIQKSLTQVQFNSIAALIAFIKQLREFVKPGPQSPTELVGI